jgi:NTE family protein
MAGAGGSVPARNVGLCLSGGGYRAAVFHLGSLIRLNEAGLFPRLRTVSSVSGGSIVAGLLGLGWRRLTFDERGVATNLASVLIDPLLDFTSRGLDVGAVLTSAFIPGLISRRVQQRYRALLGDATLAELPDHDDGPEFVITATNLSTGALFRFSRHGVGDFHRKRDDTSIGFFQGPTMPLVTAVAASSAFPPILSPCIVDLRDFSDSHAAQRTVYLTDGGIYDNLGMEPLDGAEHKVVLSSDGGAPFTVKKKPPMDYLLSTIHVLKVVDLQVRKLRRFALVGSAQERKVAYWAISSDLADYVVGGSEPGQPSFEVLGVSDQARAALAGISTRLAALDRVQQHRLINWGYAGCDAAMRRYAFPGPRGAFPYKGGAG